MSSKPIPMLFLTILSSHLFLSPSHSYSSSSQSQSQSQSNTTTTTTKNTSFIQTACNTTTYPPLCLKTCLPDATKIACDSRKLAISALTAALTASQTSASAVAKLFQQKNLGKYEANVVKDCFENIGDSIDKLKESMKEMNDLIERSQNNGKYYNSDEARFKVSNVKTWMSAAITNENTCMDGIKEGKTVAGKVSPNVKAVIGNAVMGVVKLSSNALSLCNHLQY